jgi:ATP-grasp domain
MAIQPPRPTPAPVTDRNCFPLSASGGRARELVAGFIARPSRGGWLPHDATAELLGCYGLPLADSTVAATDQAAAAAAARSGGPVTLRADVPGLLRTSDARDVLAGLRGADEVRHGFGLLQEAFGSRLPGVIVQPVVTGGVEVMISVLHEQVADPQVLLGAGGPADNELADRAVRLAPLTDADADDLIRSVRAALRCSGAAAQSQRSWPLCGTCCCGSPGWSRTCRRSPNSSSAPSSLAPTASRPSTAGSVSRPPNPPMPTCADCHKGQAPTTLRLGKVESASSYAPGRTAGGTVQRPFEAGNLAAACSAGHLTVYPAGGP